jgi:hypothetical protein
MNFQDNRVFAAMVKNRPTIAQVPAINKRILAQKIGTNAFFFLGLTTIGTLILYKYFMDASSLYVVKTRKSFSFESDPYSGKVKCSYA